MGAPVASGTLAGSISGSWDSIHKEAAGGGFSRFRRHPRVVRLAQLSRPSRSRTSSSGTISATARSRRRRSASPAVRDSSVRETRRREPAVVCQQPSVVRSPQFGDHRRSRPRGRRDYRNRGIAITPTSARARSLPVETNRPVKAVLAAQLKPDGSRSRLLSHRSRASTDAALHRHAGPADGRHGPRSAAAASPGEAVASSPRARALLQLVRSGRLVRDSGRFRSAGKRA